jgi:dTDP-4-dehydrorhamnose reductase
MSIELWAGVECTFNRVGDRYYSQLHRSGHWQRPKDIERFAALDIRVLRYPFLWELIAPESDVDRGNWSWAEQRLDLIRACGIRPIAGLLHHGSGPSWTDLCDAKFPQALANYALAFATRFPLIEDYTPVNEPLTTARFSALYGIWYPHRNDKASFARALVNQCKAIALSMQAIRSVNPRARLVQTEDFGKTFSTPELAYQADFENARRWLSLDLLCGRITEQHPFWPQLRLGVEAEELRYFLEHPCPPDVVGLNYYLTSDRYLDHRVENYAPELHGGNGIDRYVDVSAVHVPEVSMLGHEQCLLAAWERYQRPVAFTEVHINSSREDQMRWLREAWVAAHRAQAAGADVRALTVWSLLGSFDWNSLVTVEQNFYESGSFDARSNPPRPTRLAAMVKDINSRGDYEHPVLKAPGWWRRPCRILTKSERIVQEGVVCEFSRHQARPILVTGATGTLGRAFGRVCESRALSYRLLSRRRMDVADQESVERCVRQFNPWAIVNTAGYVRVDEAENDPAACFRENTKGVETLATACARHDIPFVTFSSDLVFDGTNDFGYVETDKVAPLSVYGQSKAEAERYALAICPLALVIRTSSFFGPWDEFNFLTQALRSWANGRSIAAAEDITITPTYVPDLVNTALDLLLDEVTGIWHLTNPDAVSWADLAGRLADLTGFSSALIERRDRDSLPYIAPRPKCSALASRRGRLLPPLQSCLERYLSESEFTDSHLSSVRK